MEKPLDPNPWNAAPGELRHDREDEPPPDFISCEPETTLAGQPRVPGWKPAEDLDEALRAVKLGSDLLYRQCEELKQQCEALALLMRIQRIDIDDLIEKMK